MPYNLLVYVQCDQSLFINSFDSSFSFVLLKYISFAAGNAILCNTRRKMCCPCVTEVQTQKSFSVCEGKR